MKMTTEEKLRRRIAREQFGLRSLRFERVTNKCLDYAGRDFVIKCLGFKSYAEYLLSPLWAGIRERAFQKYGRRCRLCGQFATQLHHVKYRRCNLDGWSIALLRPLCRSCHEKVEFTGPSKNTAKKAELIYRLSELRQVARGNPCRKDCYGETMKDLENQLAFIEKHQRFA